MAVSHGSSCIRAGTTAKRAFLGVPVPTGHTVRFWVWKKKELCDLRAPWT